MNNVLIFGSTGFIGFNFLSFLGNSKDKIICINRKNIPQICNKNIINVNINIQNKKKIYKIFKEYNINTVVNLLGAAHNKYSSKEIKKYNYVFVKDLCNIMKKFKIKKFIHLSTAKVNMDYKKINYEKINENTYYDINPSDVYTLSKVKSEKYINNFFSTNKHISIYILRPSLVYGPNVKANFKIIMLISKYFNLIPLGEIKNGKKTFCSIYNLIKVLFCCLNENKINIKKTFLISDNKAYDVKDLLFLCGKYLYNKNISFIRINIFFYKFFMHLFKKNEAYNKIFSQMIIDNREVKKHFKISKLYGVEDTLIKMKKNCY